MTDFQLLFQSWLSSFLKLHKGKNTLRQTDLTSIILEAILVFKNNTAWFSPLNPGYLWNLQVKLEPIVNLLSDKGKLMDFLLQRKDCKMVILSVCSQSKFLLFLMGLHLKSTFSY